MRLAIRHAPLAFLTHAPDIPRITYFNTIVLQENRSRSNSQPQEKISWYQNPQSNSHAKISKSNQSDRRQMKIKMQPRTNESKVELLNNGSDIPWLRQTKPNLVDWEKDMSPWSLCTIVTLPPRSHPALTPISRTQQESANVEGITPQGNKHTNSVKMSTHTIPIFHMNQEIPRHRDSG